MRRRITKLIPGPVKELLRTIYYLPGDMLDLSRTRDGMIPPRSKIFIGRGDFIKIGERFKQRFIDQGGLQPNERVLDVGCGIGRMAIPLTNYLSKEGEYWGFDIVKSGIDWCQERITPRFPNFQFLHSDVYNKYYNPDGKIQAQDYQFPFEDNFFDFVFLTSVFTHMLPPDVENYTSEIARVLRTGGRCLITFFILNEESLRLVHAGKSVLDFKYDLGGCLSTDMNTPEAAIAYEEGIITGLFEKNRLMIYPSIYYGSWCGREKFFTYQDLIVAKKKRSS
jgi:SAM-dependent methyltransferase